MANNETGKRFNYTNRKLGVVETSIDTSNLQYPSAEERQGLTSEELGALVEPFLKEKEEVQKEAISLIEYVSKEIHPAMCCSPSEVYNMSTAEVEDMILWLRCLIHDRNEMRRGVGDNGW